MRLTALSLAALAAVASPAAASQPSNHWAVIAAGSAGYDNYRHQADACHAYQIMVKAGIPKDQIILMMQDDVAADPENPFPGKLFNKPATDAGVDVYAGCSVDYRGDAVTAQLFMDVLTGKAAGKSLKSDKNSHVFVNFVDHGGSGLIAFPNGPYLYADQLMTTLSTMNTQGMYKKLTFYMEACESGSMFEGILPENIDIYATTASNADESSWGTYCPPDDVVGGTELNSCLGDLYSVNWMENSDSSDLSTETLQQQFEKVQKLTDQSHVMQYGTLGWTSLPVSAFIGTDDTVAAEVHRSLGRTRRVAPAEEEATSAKARSTVSSRDVRLHNLHYRLLRAKDDAARAAATAALKAEMEHREMSDSLFGQVRASAAASLGLEAVPSASRPTNFDCLRSAVDAVESRCGKFSDYSLKYVRDLVDVCEASGHAAKVVTEAVAKHC